ncbi:MAG TPA: AarF/ABC1/UbiB kinase family protein [Solirubrobacteraceae bacterium]
MSDLERSPNKRDARGDGIGRGRLRRTAPLVGLTAQTAGEAAIARLRGKWTEADRGEFYMRSAERYTELLGHSKGALMKVGQMASFALISPTVPAELQSLYQASLMRLCDDVPPMAPMLAREVLERELGQRAESVFAQFAWEPLAAASVGQVHAAQLHDGRDVAVKIQYPGASDAIRADLKNTELLATFLTLTVGGMSSRRLSFDLRGAAREVGARIVEELDYRLEAINQAEFADYYRGHPFIHVPDVIKEFCTGHVLTQELVHGWSWSEALTARQELRDQWAEAIFRFVYGSYERIYQFNADPHPGNYIFHEDGSVTFLDFGCVKRFRPEQVKIMDEVMRECLRGDVLGTWRACVEAGFCKSSVAPEEIFDYWRGDGEMLWANERFTVTPEYAARRIERRCSPNGPSGNVFRHITMSPEYTFMTRMELGVLSVIAQLRACNLWGSITAEHFERAQPLTDMGKRERAFLDEGEVEVANPV